MYLHVYFYVHIWVWIRSWFAVLQIVTKSVMWCWCRPDMRRTLAVRQLSGRRQVFVVLVPDKVHNSVKHRLQTSSAAAPPRTVFWQTFLSAVAARYWEADCVGWRGMWRGLGNYVCSKDSTGGVMGEKGDNFHCRCDNSLVLVWRQDPVEWRACPECLVTQLCTDGCRDREGDWGPS